MELKEAVIIFSHQLFADLSFLQRNQKIYIVEDELFFRQYRFHKTKLVFHRASMKYYQTLLQSKGHEAIYLETNDELCSTENLFDQFRVSGVTKVTVTDPVDYLLTRRLKRYAGRYDIALIIRDSPMFMATTEFNRSYFESRKNYHLYDYYSALRRQTGLLMQHNKPIGGRWTFDDENRKKMPAGHSIPESYISEKSSFWNEAIVYVEKHFPDNPGDAGLTIYLHTHGMAVNALNHFLENNFRNYGTYQDAMLQGENFLHHSVLSPMLNSGLITPTEVIESAVNFAFNNEIPINSLEGFVRQIAGWREFIRGVYEYGGVKQRKSNHFNHDQPLPQTFYTGETGFPPVDDAIRKALKTGYNHHIERLMILGNFMLLTKTRPDDVYKWFMELFIDAYDWVMVPNIYGMSQFADGGLMSTKPYISGSNYLRKMSNYPAGDWCSVWDALYWNFIFENQAQFRKNQRMSLMVRQLEKMDKQKLQNHLEISHQYLNSIKTS